MSRPAPIPGKTHASARPLGDARELAPREAAIGSAKRRLLMITRLGDLAMTVTEAVAERALAEEAAAKAAAIALKEAAEVEPAEVAPVVSHVTNSESDTSQDNPAQDSPSQMARADDRTRAAPRAGSRATGRTPTPRAAALFARLCDIVHHCLDLEIRLEAELRRLQAAPFDTDDLGARHRDEMGDQMRDAGWDAALNKVHALVEAAVAEEAKTRREAGEQCEGRRERPGVVHAATLRRDQNLHPNHSLWAHPPPRPEEPPPRRSKSALFNEVSRTPLLDGLRAKQAAARPAVAKDPADRRR